MSTDRGSGFLSLGVFLCVFIPCAFGLERWPVVGLALVCYAIAITGIATLTNACPDYDIYNPLFEVHLPLLLRSELAPNLGMLLGVAPGLSLLMFAVFMTLILVATVMAIHTCSKGPEQTAAPSPPANPGSLLSRPPPGPPGFTLIESLVCVGIIAVLASLLLPAATRAKGRGWASHCINNLRQLQLAWQMYADDSSAALPSNEAEFDHGTWRSAQDSWVGPSSAPFDGDGWAIQ